MLKDLEKGIMAHIGVNIITPTGRKRFRSGKQLLRQTRQRVERVDKAKRVAKLAEAYARLADSEISPFDEEPCCVSINHSAFHRAAEKLAVKIGRLDHSELPE